MSIKTSFIIHYNPKVLVSTGPYVCVCVRCSVGEDIDKPQPCELQTNHNLKQFSDSFRGSSSLAEELQEETLQVFQ